jgi:hypothetical protein
MSSTLGLEEGTIRVTDQRLVAVFQLTLQCAKDRGTARGTLPGLLVVAADNVALRGKRHRFDATARVEKPTRQRPEAYQA